MSNLEQFINTKINKLLIIEIFQLKKNHKYYCKCLCDCGTEKIIRLDSILRATTKSCGCLQRDKIKPINIGQQFGLLIIIKHHHYNKSEYRHYYLCQCKCGNNTIVCKNSLINNQTKSCGCLHKEIVRNRMTGSNHYAWRHDLTKEERELSKNRMYSPQYREWRTKVYHRDNYICQVCKSNQGGNLVAHHIES